MEASNRTPLRSPSRPEPAYSWLAPPCSVSAKGSRQVWNGSAPACEHNEGSLRLRTMGWQIQVSENQQLVFAGESDPPVELGRQADRSETPYSLKQIDDHWRVVIAPLEEHNVSRRHALVETAPEKCVRITNLSTQQPVRLIDSSDLPPHDSCVAPLPVTFTVGNKTIRIQEN